MSFYLPIMNGLERGPTPSMFTAATVIAMEVDSEHRKKGNSIGHPILSLQVDNSSVDSKELPSLRLEAFDAAIVIL